MMSSTRKWLWSILLPLPLWVLIALHIYAAKPGSHPTGFLQQDTPFYAGRVREVYDTGHFSPFYSNPCDPSYDGPKIYFQLQSLILAPISHYTGIPTPYAILLFQIVFSILFALACMALFEETTGLRPPIESSESSHGPAGRSGLINQERRTATWLQADWFLFLLFFWGGGVLCALGIGVSILQGDGLKDALFHAFRFEPDGLGWWALNIGRNVANQYEGYFHCISFLSILALMRRRFVLSLVLAAMMVASHIVTGLEILLILLMAGGVERWFGNKEIPLSYLAGASSLLVVHLWFYMVYQNSFPAHHLLSLQNKEPWLLQAKSFVPAFALVGVMLAWQLRTAQLAREFFRSSSNRVLASWAFMAFLLSNHEFAIDPMQPVHFTRGYVMAPLFLLGVGALRELLAVMDRWRSATLRLIAMCLLAGAFLFDNVCWFSALGYSRTFMNRDGGDFYITSGQQEILDWLAICSDQPRPVVVSEDLRLGYLVITYTPLRSWASHDHETPNYKQHIAEIQALTETGTILPQWLTTPTLWVIKTGSTAESALIKAGATVRFENAAYKIFSIQSSDKPSQTASTE